MIKPVYILIYKKLYCIEWFTRSIIHFYISTNFTLSLSIAIFVIFIELGASPLLIWNQSLVPFQCMMNMVFISGLSHQNKYNVFSVSLITPLRLLTNIHRYLEVSLNSLLDLSLSPNHSLTSLPKVPLLHLSHFFKVPLHYPTLFLLRELKTALLYQFMGHRYMG